MMDFVFSKAELESYNKEQLIKIAQYYNVSLRNSWSKQRMVDTFIEKFFSSNDALMDNETPMSVRVKRIQILNQGRS